MGDIVLGSDGISDGTRTVLLADMGRVRTYEFIDSTDVPLTGTDDVEDLGTSQEIYIPAKGLIWLSPTWRLQNNTGSAVGWNPGLGFAVDSTDYFNSADYNGTVNVPAGYFYLPTGGYGVWTAGQLPFQSATAWYDFKYDIEKSGIPTGARTVQLRVKSHASTFVIQGNTGGMATHIRAMVFDFT